MGKPFKFIDNNAEQTNAMANTMENKATPRGSHREAKRTIEEHPWGSIQNQLETHPKPFQKPLEIQSNPLDIHSKSMGDPFKTNRKSIQHPWGIHSKPMGNSFKTHGKTIENPCKIDGESIQHQLESIQHPLEAQNARSE